MIHRSMLLMSLFFVFILVGCGGSSGGGGSGNQGSEPEQYSVSATAGVGGSISPATLTVNEGDSATFTLQAENGFSIGEVTGCNGSLSGNTYTTGAISGNCTITSSFLSIPVENTPLVVFRLAESDLGTGIGGLMTVQVDGQNHSTLNPVLPVGGEVLSFEWSPSGDRISYLADQNIDEDIELFSVLPDGTGLVTLNATLVAGGDVIDYQWSPDSTKLAYRANQDQDNFIELYVVDADGLNRVKINRTLVAGGNVESYAWSMDSSQLLYSADALNNDQFELFLSSSDGSVDQQVNATLSAGDQVENFQWSPEGTYISYVINVSGSDDDALFVYNLVSSSNIQLDSGISVSIDELGYVWSDNDAFVAVAQSNRPGVLEVGQVFIISADGAGVITGELDIRHRASAISFVPSATSLLVVSDSGALVLGDSDTVYHFADDGSELNRVDLIGSNSSGGQVIDSFLFSPDTEKVVLVGGYDSWFYNLNSGVANRFIDGDNSGDIIQYTEWSEDSSRLYYVEFTDTTPTVLSPDGSQVNELDNSNNIRQESLRWVNNRILYITSNGGSVTGGTVESVDQFGGDRLILGELPAGSSGPGVHNIESYTVSFDNSFIVYDLESSMLNNSGEELFSVNLDGTANVQISGVLQPGTSIEDYAIQPQ